MLMLLVGVGLLFTLGTGFFQVRRFPVLFKKTFGTMLKGGKSGGITPFQAMATALASTVGTGNIAGVATAITAGGPGAIFWMWISSLLGMMTKYAEVVLAVHYRHRDKNGQWVGGPMYTIERGLGKQWRWLAAIFSLFGMAAGLGMGNITQVNTMAEALNGSFGVPPLVTGIVTMAVAGIVILGGVKSIARSCELLVPFMSALYIIAAAAVLFIFRQNIIPALQMIVREAFHPTAVAGGAGGYFLAMRMGVQRGVFSNEAGLGSAPIAHASAETEHPAAQGMWGAVEVFLDTIVICTLTALVILCSGAYVPSGTSPDGATLTLSGFTGALGPFGADMVTVCTVMFALATILGWSLYGERCCGYLFKSRTAAMLYKAVYIVLLLPGALLHMDIVWSMADFLNNLMAAPNLVSLIALCGVVFKLTRQYEASGK